MGLKLLSMTLSDVGSNRNLRLDFRYVEFSKKIDLFKSFQPFRRQVLSISNGRDIGKNDYVDYNTSDIIYPTVNNLSDGAVDLSAVLFVNDSWAEENSKTLKSDDLVISRSGTVGLTCVWSEEEVNRIFDRSILTIPSGYLIVVSIRKEGLLPKF